MKLYNEFFDELERVLVPAALFVIASIVASVVFNFSFDFSGVNQENFHQKLRDMFEKDRIKIISVFIFSFILNLYSLMGLWHCLVKKEKAGARDFFQGANSGFFSGFFPYLLINLYPGAIFLLTLYAKGPQGYGLFKSAFFLILIFFSLWLGARISLWQGFAVSGRKFLSSFYDSFRITRSRAYMLFWILIFPYAFFGNIGSSVTWKFLVYSFLFFNAAILPLAVEISRYMIFIRLTGSARDAAGKMSYEMP